MGRLVSRGRSHLISAANRRKVSWSAGPKGFTSIQSTAGAELFSVTAVSGLNDLTLVRIRGEFRAWLLTASAEGEGFEWAAGICNVSENAAGVGITAVPHPFTDMAWDGWIWHSTGSLHSRDNAPAADNSGATMVKLEIDNKAMRKVHLSDTLVGVFESAVESGTSTIRASLLTRVLDKLP